MGKHRSTQRVIDILKQISRNDDGLTLTELAVALNAPKSSLFPIIHTLCDNKMISQNPLSQEYVIGGKVCVAMSVAIPVFRYSNEKEKQIIMLLKDAKGKIEQLINTISWTGF